MKLKCLREKADEAELIQYWLHQKEQSAFAPFSTTSKAQKRYLVELSFKLSPICFYFVELFYSFKIYNFTGARICFVVESFSEFY